MRNVATSNRFCVSLRTLAVLFRAVLIATVERVIRAGDEGFSPLDEGGREKSCDHANNHLLQKRGVHSVVGAGAVPLTLTKNPIVECA